MSRPGNYGQSFAQKHLTEGRLREALAEVEKEIARDPEDPEPFLLRAQVHLAMGEFEAAVTDLRRCQQLDELERVVDDGLVDDTLFSALLGWGRTLAPTDPKQAVDLLSRYSSLMPRGCHHGEATDWQKRFRGETQVWIKAQ
jgi:hypothetical protein